MNIRCMHCMKEYEDEYDLCPYCGYVRGTEPDEVYFMYPGSVLADRYIVGTALGYGGFGITYKAWDSKLETIVAIKEYYPTSLVNRIPGEQYVSLYSPKSKNEFSNGLKRFMDEARNTALFSKHMNIVHVYDFFECNGTAYIVMEYLDGCNLKMYLEERGGTIDIDDTINILISVIEALKAVHEKGFLHRDISPDNIFICNNGVVKLIDFGAARFSEGAEEKGLTIVLKPGYAPPEQYESRSKQGPWTDIYALGATMYRAITGVIPDESSNRKIEDIVQSPKELNPDIPDYIDVSIMVAMAITPELRFQNVQQFEDAILNKRKVISIEADLKRRKRRRKITISAVVLLLLAAGGITLGVYRTKKMKAELVDATLSVWVMVDDGRTSEEEQAIFEASQQVFQEDFPQIEFEVEYIEESEYETRLENACQEGTLPNLFESTDASEEVLSHTADVSDVLDLIDVKNYYFLNQYRDCFPDGSRMPTSYLIPLRYTNTVLQDEGNTDITYDINSFIQKEAAEYIGSSEDYYELTNYDNGLNGQLAVSAVDEDGAPIFCNTWSVSSDSDMAEELAAERFISYLLNDQNQDTYYVQNYGALPLNKNVMSQYIEIFGSDGGLLEFLQELIDNAEIDENSPMDSPCMQ